MVVMNKPTLVGLLCLCAFLLQYFLNLQWTWLFQLQQDEQFKRWSGLVLALFILFQWLLTFTRAFKKYRKHAMSILTLHKWIGAVSPLLFYIHSMVLGYGYLLMLSYIFFSNTLLGYFNLDVIKNNSEWLFKGWMIVHVAMSIIVTIIMIFHITMVFYYK